MLTWPFGIERDLVEVLVQLASFVGALSPRLLNLGILSGNRSLLFALGLPFLNFGQHPLGIPFEQGVLVGFPIGVLGLALSVQIGRFRARRRFRLGIGFSGRFDLFNLRISSFTFSRCSFQPVVLGRQFAQLAPHLARAHGAKARSRRDLAVIDSGSIINFAIVNFGGIASFVERLDLLSSLDW